MKKFCLLLVVCLFVSVGMAAPKATPMNEDVAGYVESLIAANPEWNEGQVQSLEAIIEIVSQPWAYSDTRSRSQEALIGVAVKRVESVFSPEELILFTTRGRGSFEAREGDACLIQDCDCYATFFDCPDVWSWTCRYGNCTESSWWCGLFWLFKCLGVCTEVPS